MSLDLLSGLRVLMYHKFSMDRSDGLTVTLKEFHRQVEAIRSLGIRFIDMQEFLMRFNDPTLYQERVALLTIDDGYQNNADLLFPLLGSLELPVCVFLPVEHLGKFNSWDKEQEALMSLETLKLWQSKWITYGLHSFSHKNFRSLSADEVGEDLRLCKEVMNSNNLNYYPIVAYPYGAYPRNSELQKQKDCFLEFEKSGIKLGFRIGNRLTRKVPSSPYLVQRLDIRGDEGFIQFRMKVLFGRFF